MSDWKERDGPSVVEPADRGFGSFLIEKVLRADLRGEIEMKFERDGVECRIVLPPLADMEEDCDEPDTGSR